MNDNEKVIAALLSKDHGWWWDCIDEVVKPNGKINWRLRKTPYFSPGYLAMYGYKRAEDVSIDKLFPKPERWKILSIIASTIEPGSPAVSETSQAITASGKTKLVEIYTRRIEGVQSCPILASLHLDLTVSNDHQWINRTVLKRLKAFVFLKRFNEVTAKFEFEYINKQLADALGLGGPEAAIGKTDSEYFDDPLQVKAFAEADEKVAFSKDGNLILVTEEEISPRSPDLDSTANGGKPSNRFMTFKMRYLRPEEDFSSPIHRVLGIAVDVTHVTDQLRAVAQRSENGIFIKDDQFRYTLANEVFLKLFGKSHEREVLGKKFEDLLSDFSALHNLGSKTTHQSEVIRQDDQQTLDLGEAQRTGPFVLSGGDLLFAQKRRILVGHEQKPYILGVTTTLISKILDRFIGLIPQCIVVKRYNPGQEENEFTLVWGNSAYLESHGLKSFQEIVGKSDFGLWSKPQATRYRDSDRRAIRAGKAVGADMRSNLINALKREQCWEFRESQEGKAGDPERSLQTTKWPVQIAGVWFVIVIFSDVTAGDENMVRHHKMTIHNLASSLTPIHAAERFLTRKGPGDVAQAQQLLKDANEALDFFFRHHLKHLRGEIVLKPCTVGDVCDTLSDVIRRIEHGFKDPPLNLDFGEVAPTERACLIDVDLIMIRSVLIECLMNSCNAMKAAAVEYANAKGGFCDAEYFRTHGWLEAEMDYSPRVRARISVFQKQLSIEIGDNGEAHCSSDKQTHFQKCFAAAKDVKPGASGAGLGLPFIFYIMRGHSGEATLNFERKYVNVLLTLNLKV